MKTIIRILAVALTAFALAEVNYPHLTPQTQLATFAMLGLVLCFLTRPAVPRFRDQLWSRALDVALAVAAVVVCGYVAVQNEPMFASWWLSGQSLGDRAGAEMPLDFAIGTLGLIVVLEAARRTVGLALPLLAGAFLLYGMMGPSLPGWLFPHRGYDLDRLVSQSYLHSQGVFGVALRVMFTYVFLFVVFGALLEATGGTGFIIEKARRLFRGATGGPAKVAVLSSGLMGSLSGSAVANTATTGTFTIPLMISAGFRRHVAAGIEAAASAGGALVPPVMGAGAYMMLELVDPPVTYLQIVRAALLPAILYYLSIFLTVHFHALRAGTRPTDETPDVDVDVDVDANADRDGQTIGNAGAGWQEGLTFFGGLGALLAFLFYGTSVFRAVSLALVVVLVLSYTSVRTRVTPKRLLDALVKAARAGLPLIAAAACVGIVIGVVTLTGVGSKLPSTIIPLADQNLFLALVLLMVSSIVLGLGLPSAVCYLLLATLIGPALAGLGVAPLAAHLFIFYFGLMSMVTPPVALAAYTAASIAGSRIMRTAFTAFKFALVGFALPFVFVYRPELLMLTHDGGDAAPLAIALAVALTATGIVALAASTTGYLLRPLGAASRCALLLVALILFAREPWLATGLGLTGLDLAAIAGLVGIGVAGRSTS